MSSVAEKVGGGAFILGPSDYQGLFIPENRDEEQDMVYTSTRDFVKNEIKPIWKRIEKKEAGLSEKIFSEMGALGLLGAHMPQQYGGADLDSNTVALLLTSIGEMGSFNTPYAAHTGIGMLPILYFGTEAQKEQYLPDMIEGKLIASYCLTEPTSGSDALSAKTVAMWDEAKGKYILNGQKMWISNAGYAGIFIVFAQVEGDKFSAFIVEREAEGLTMGEEEEKLGIHGSSTRQVYFENVEVDKDQLLGELGKGHLIAFNVLNMGRFKLGALCVSGAQQCLKLSSNYAQQRVQFGKPISSFGAIQAKIALQAAKTAALQSATFRISTYLTDKIKELKEQGLDSGKAKLAAAKEFAVECSIIKVAGSEIIDYIVDETVQVYGGMGYSEEAEPARIYRDSRINRIYEGTNEINRLLIVDQLFKKGMKGELPMMEALMAGKPGDPEGEYSQEAHQMRSVVIKLLSYIGRRQMAGELNLETEQEVTMALSDLGIGLFMIESLWMRIMKRKDSGHDNIENWWKLYQLYCHDVMTQSGPFIYTIISRLFQGEEFKDKWTKVNAMIAPEHLDIVKIQREIADWVNGNDGEIV